MRQEWAGEENSSNASNEIFMDAHDTRHADMDKLYSNILSEILKGDLQSREITWQSSKSYWTISRKIAASVVIFFIASLVLYLTHFQDEIEATPERVVVSKRTEAGEKLTTKLPDGTLIILNSMSQISYVSGFEENERKVDLIGEAYFEVAKDTSKPFIVKSGPIEARVLGTSFNFKSYSDSEDVTIALTGGKVEVVAKEEIFGMSSHILNPGEEAYYSQGKPITVRKFDYLSVVGWKDGILVFNDADIDEIKDKLEKWFGVEILLLNRPHSSWSFTTTYRRNASLENVLEGLKFSKNIAYKIRQQKVEIMFHSKDDYMTE